MSFYKILTQRFALAFVCLFSFLIVTAQKSNDNYTMQWRKIDDLVSKGLTKSALAEISKIYNAAKKSKNDPQIIKSLLFFCWRTASICIANILFQRLYFVFIIRRKISMIQIMLPNFW